MLLLSIYIIFYTLLHTRTLSASSSCFWICQPLKKPVYALIVSAEVTATSPYSRLTTVTQWILSAYRLFCERLSIIKLYKNQPACWCWYKTLSVHVTFTKGEEAGMSKVYSLYMKWIIQTCFPLGCKTNQTAGLFKHTWANISTKSN